MAGQLEPETIYAFRLSGENAAAVAPESSKGVSARPLEEQLVQTMTCCGESTVSEKITLEPSGEMASTVPATFWRGVTLVPFETTIAPLVPKATLSTPKNSFPPVRSNLAELGVKVKGTGFPAVNGAVLLERVMGTTVVIQVTVVAEQPLELTYTVGLLLVDVLPGVTVKEIACFG